MANYFEIEQPMIDRLAASMPVEVLVESADYLASIDENDNGFAPAVFVLPLGSEFAGDEIQRETQLWQVALIVPHYRDDDDSITSITKAGAYLETIVGLLLGWKPAEGYSPLRLAGRSDAEYHNGLAGFPLVFDTTRIIC
jgi:hypothetical protein